MLNRIKICERPERILILPMGWKEIPSPMSWELAYRNTRLALNVLVSVDTMEDGKKFLHVSASHYDVIPSWPELKEVKRVFIGPEREAFHFIPKDSEFVNVHNYCMHLWSEEK